MRPLSLAVQGFTAFRERQDVSFAELDLFVITGPTGAGKSSLLDAMVFALYGEVPRLGGRDGIRDLVSLGQAEARVTFEFSVRGGDERYRVARRLRRKGVQSATFERAEGADWIPVIDRGGVTAVNPKVAEVVGLGFASFCRAVVLPQGEFHRFLKGDAGERRKVLFSLLGVDYFQRMAELARARGNLLDAGLQRTEQIIAEQYSDATEELVDQRRGSSDRAAERARALAQACVAAEELTLLAAAQERRSQALSAQIEELGALVAALDELELTSVNVSSALEEAQGALGRAADLHKMRRDGAAAAEAAVTTLEAQHGPIERLALARAAAEALREAAGNEERAVSAATQAKTEAHEATAIHHDAEQKRGALASELASAQHAYESATTELQDARRRYERWRDGVAAAVKLQTERTSAREAIDQAQASARKAGDEVERARGSWTESREEFEERRRGAALSAISSGLAAGDPCPVCGTPLTSAVHVGHDGRQTIEVAAEAEAKLREDLDHAARLATRFEARCESAEENLARVERELRVTLGEAADMASMHAEQESLAARGAELGQQATQQREALETLRRRCEAAREHAARAGASAAGAVAGAESAQTSLAETLRRHEESSAVLTEHFRGVVPPDAPQRVAARHEQLSGALGAARVARIELDAATAAESTARQAAEREQRRWAAIDAALAGLRSRGSSVRRTLAGEVELAPLPSRDDAGGVAIAALRSWSALSARDTEAQRDRAQRRLTAAIGDLRSAAAALQLDSASASAAMAALKQADREAAQAVVRAQSALEWAAERLQQRQTMEAQIVEERRESLVLRELAQDLRQDRFGEFIVQETLGVLAAGASEELLRISDGRYRLVAQRGEFEVVDHANADERRSVKTLSGGETFLASLALALALSRHIGELAGEGLGAKLEAVFVDEGFGTLDPATLDEAIDALERLREDDLVVGVISHVPELAQRIRAGLEVRKEEGRSWIVAVPP